jgi:predicted nucleic acid-binding Zn ribbon protein
VKRDIARELFKAYRTKVRKRDNERDEERTHRDDPEKISSILKNLSNTKDWRKGLAEGNLFTNWSKIVGSDIAEHSEPITIFEGKLTIRAASTAWATQLRLLENELLKTIQNQSEGALIESLVIIGPNAPTWKRGLRTIRGARGPRDTYG